jgi:hypothetical protein
MADFALQNLISLREISIKLARTQLLKLWKLIPQELTASPLYPLRYPDNFLRHLCHIPEQYLPAILQRKEAFLALFHSKMRDLTALSAK